jgi:hypothetical protein
MLFLPIAAYAQSGSPFDTGFTALQTLFTGTIFLDKTIPIRTHDVRGKPL